MNALRIRKRLDAPIPELPELTPLIGKHLEIIVLEETSSLPIRSISQLRGDKQKPVARFEDLLGGWPEDQLDDGFEEAVDQWRREPWRSEDLLNDSDQSGGGNG